MQRLFASAGLSVLLSGHTDKLSFQAPGKVTQMDKFKQALVTVKQSAARKVAGAATLALAAPAAFAQGTPSQPDVSDVVLYILGSIATIALIGNASLMVNVALRVYGWVRAAIR